jgi:hypothetical protein
VEGACDVKDFLIVGAVYQNSYNTSQVRMILSPDALGGYEVLDENGKTYFASHLGWQWIRISAIWP